MVRGARLRAVPRGRARDRVGGRGRARRVHGDRDGGRLRCRRVARRPAVVYRRRRDVGHQLRRLHRDPGGEAPAAAPARDRAVPGDRRSLPDRRALHRRLHHGQRALAIRGEPGRDERDAARRLVPWRCVARRLACPARGDATVAHRVGAAPDRRAVLAQRLARAGLRRHRGGDPQRRRLVRLLCRRGVPDAGPLHRTDANARRQLGPRLAVERQPGPEPRRAARGRAVLRSLAQGRAERPRRRAAGRLVRTRLRRAGTVPGGVAGSVAGLEGVPPPRDPRRRVAVRCRVAAARRPAGGRWRPGGCDRGDRSVSAPAGAGDARRTVVGRRQRAERARARPATG